MKLRLYFFGIILFAAAQMQAQSDSDWEKYLNASFMPPGNTAVLSQINAISDDDLRRAAQTAQGIEVNAVQMSDVVVVESKTSSRKPKESVGKKENIDAAAAAESSLEKAFIPAQNLPEIIAHYEQTANQAELKTLYARYKSDYPLHPAAYNYANEVLKSLPANAILLTQGQLDTYPLLTDQATANRRKDVVVININWLKNSIYRNKIEKQLGKNPGWTDRDEPKTMINKLVQQFPQRLYLSMTLDRQLLQSLSAQIYPIGLAFSVQPVSAAKHHDALAKVDWNMVLQANLPQYMRALHANYLAALLVDEKMKQPASLGKYNRTFLLNQLYQQTGLKKPAENYLKN
jgi:hypothetical protein